MPWFGLVRSQTCQKLVRVWPSVWDCAWPPVGGVWISGVQYWLTEVLRCCGHGHMGGYSYITSIHPAWPLVDLCNSIGIFDGGNLPLQLST